jgi:phage terminase large subunit-like protein
LTSSAPVLPAPPSGDWVLKGGRSTGKTTCGARWLLAEALAAPEGSLWAVCAPTWEMARCSLEALIALAAPGDIESYASTRLDVTLRNKARIKGFSSESPDSIRGYNFAGA